jgi:hypothetical protein
MVDSPARAVRRRDPERHRDRDCQEEAEQGQLGRRRQAGQQLLSDRLPGAQRIAEIAMRKSFQIIDELDRQAAVEAERGGFPRRLGRRRPAK